ncbi:MAG: hypothetical protein ACRDJI_05490, partial [Actinomycetota bacterium]
MQQAEESPRARPDAPDEGSGSVLSPLRAFLVLLAVLVAAGVLIVATGSEDDPPPATNTAPAKYEFSLTDEEAITRFTELRERAFKSVEERDISLISAVFTQDGPTARRASREIRRLLQD